MFGAAFGTMLSGRRVERGGRIKPWPIAGAVVAMAGMALLSLLTRSTPTVLVALFVLLVGLGAGFMMQPSLLAVQNAAASSDLGTATSTGLLFRMLGSTIGVPIFGGLINGRLGDGPRNPTTFAHALTPVFMAAAFVAVLALAFAVAGPGTRRCAIASASTWIARECSPNRWSERSRRLRLPRIGPWRSRLQTSTSNWRRWLPAS